MLSVQIFRERLLRACVCVGRCFDVVPNGGRTLRLGVSTSADRAEHDGGRPGAHVCRAYAHRSAVLCVALPDARALGCLTEIFFHFSLSDAFAVYECVQRGNSVAERRIGDTESKP